MSISLCDPEGGGKHLPMSYLAVCNLRTSWEATDGPGMAHNVMASLSKAVPLASVRDKAPIRKHNYAETKTSQGRSLRLAQEFWEEILYGAPSTGWAGHIHKDWSPVTTIFPHIDSRRAEISD